MGIYKANSYNPITSIQAGLREATERGKLAGDKYRADADFWKGATEIGQKFADDMGKVGLNAYDMYVEQNDTPEARLAALEKERNEAVYEQQVKQRNRVNDYLMSGEHGTDRFRNPEIPQGVKSSELNSMDNYQKRDISTPVYNSTSWDMSNIDNDRTRPELYNGIESGVYKNYMDAIYGSKPEENEMMGYKRQNMDNYYPSDYLNYNNYLYGIYGPAYQPRMDMTGYNNMNNYYPTDVMAGYNPQDPKGKVYRR